MPQISSTKARSTQSKSRKEMNRRISERWASDQKAIVRELEKRRLPTEPLLKSEFPGQGFWPAIQLFQPAIDRIPLRFSRQSKCRRARWDYLLYRLPRS